MPRIKAVVDTNIFIRAMIGSPANEKIRQAFEDNLFELISSKEMIEELADVLSRPKLGIDIEDTKKLLHLIKNRAAIGHIKVKITACRDACDDIILEAAVNSKADVIVTNDKDLLILKTFQEIKIIPPHEFLIRLERN